MNEGAENWQDKTRPLKSGSDPTRIGDDADLSGTVGSLQGRTIGNCTLVRKIAHGGMGVVYEAKQDAPERTVALKIMRSRLASESARYRFAFEARLLGNLTHPGIAQIHESGIHTDEEGEELPYFVMEYVRNAKPITKYVRERELTPRETLSIFADVCEAFHYGHQKGVIHRDIKPDNILIDDAGKVKIIDFGVARATSAELAVTERFTLPGELFGTPLYMSPEHFHSTDVDTRSDVYALGVVLYELLTGRLPYRTEGLELVGLAEAIREKPPIAPRSVKSDMPADVQVILLKALAKDPAHRYESAAQFSNDIRRFIAREPIAARPPSLRYQLRMFARRHRVAFASALVVLGVLIAAVIVSLGFAASEKEQREIADTQRNRATDLLRRSHEISGWVVTDLHEKLIALPGSLKAREYMLATIQDKLDGLRLASDDDPYIRGLVADTYVRIAEVYGNPSAGNLGRTDTALENYRKAIRIGEQLLEEDPGSALVERKLVGGLAGAGEMLVRAGQIEEGSALLEDAFARMKAQHERDRKDMSASNTLLYVLDRLILRDRRAARADDALEHTRLGVEVAKTRIATEPDNRGAQLQLASYQGKLGGELMEREAWDDALAALTSSRDATQKIADQALGDRAIHRDLSMTHYRLGDLLRKKGDAKGALPHYEKALAMDRELAEAEPGDLGAQSDYSITLDRVAKAYIALDRVADAVPLHMQVREIARRLADHDPTSFDRKIRLRIALNSLGTTLIKADRLQDARGPLEEGVALAEQMTRENKASATARLHLAEAQDSMGILEFQRTANMSDEQKKVALTASLGWFVKSEAGYRGLERAGTLPPWAKRIPEMAKKKVGIVKQQLGQLGVEPGGSN